jgi:predicted nucleotidyltransferase
VSPETVPLRAIVSAPLAAKIRELGDTYGVRDIRVFGSFARGDARPDSDLDLLVEYVPGHGGFAFIDFCDKVEELLARKVDVVTQASLNPVIRDRVLAQAIPL